MDDSEGGWPIFELWKKYEDITMHFNDLILQLRIQALGGVAAISTLVGLFSKDSPFGVGTSWEIATGLLGALCFFWTAIWIIDFCYYNRLLLGAAAALFVLEEASKTNSRIASIDLSTQIASAISGNIHHKLQDWRQAVGRWAFYSLVFATLLVGFTFSLVHA